MPTPTPNEEFQRAARMREGVRRLGYMTGIDSLGDSLEWEAEAIKTQANMDFSNINGTDTSGKGVAEAEADMKKTLIAGDVHNHNYYRTDGQPVGAAPAVDAPTVSPPPQLSPDELVKEAAEVAYQRLKAKLRAERAETAARPAPRTVITPAPPRTPAPPTPIAPPATAQPWWKRWAPAIVGGALATGGLGTTIYNASESSTPAPPAVVDTNTDTDTRYGFSISSDKGNGFSTE